MGKLYNLQVADIDMLALTAGGSGGYCDSHALAVAYKRKHSHSWVDVSWLVERG